MHYQTDICMRCYKRVDHGEVFGTCDQLRSADSRCDCPVGRWEGARDKMLKVKLGVCPALSVDDVTLMLGNDVAGGDMSGLISLQNRSLSQ